MTSKTTRTEVESAKEHLEKLYSGSFWFKSIVTDSDDGGMHLEFRVTDMADAVADDVPRYVGNVKICFIPVGKDIPTKGAVA